ncbi:MAG: hypothetical protein UD961_05305 [Bacteroidales bacterium]|nr:hypothetical protein [Bacteroidales bacterium]
MSNFIRFFHCTSAAAKAMRKQPIWSQAHLAASLSEKDDLR